MSGKFNLDENGWVYVTNKFHEMLDEEEFREKEPTFLPILFMPNDKLKWIINKPTTNIDEQKALKYLRKSLKKFVTMMD